MRRLAPLLPALVLLAPLGACGESPAPAKRERAERKAKPPVRVSTPDVTGPQPYEPASAVVWVGTDGIAVTDTLEPPADAKVLLPLTGGRLAVPKAEGAGIKSLLLELEARIEGETPPPGPPWSVALVVDRRVGAETLAAVIATAQVAEMWELRLVFDPQGEPTMVRTSAFARRPLEPRLAQINVELEVRRESSAITMPLDEGRQTIAASEEDCTFHDDAAIQETLKSICTGREVALNLEMVADASLTYTDIAAVLAGQAVPEGCAPLWRFGRALELKSPTCAKAVPVKDVLAKLELPDPRHAGILGLMAELDGEIPDDPTDGLSGFPLEPDPDGSAFGIGSLGTEPDVRVKTSVKENGDGIEKSIVERIIRAHQGDLVTCASTHDVKTGTVEVKVKVGSIGKVIFARTPTDDAALGEVPMCMVKAAKAWKFPKPTVVHELTFKAKIEEK